VDDARSQDMGLPRPSTSDYEQWTETVLNGWALLWLEPLKNVWTRFAESKAQLFGHARWTERLGPTEGPQGQGPLGAKRPVGHRPKAGGSAAAQRGFRSGRALVVI